MFGSSSPNCLFSYPLSGQTMPGCLLWKNRPETNRRLRGKEPIDYLFGCFLPVLLMHVRGFAARKKERLLVGAQQAACVVVLGSARHRHRVMRRLMHRLRRQRQAVVAVLRAGAVHAAQVVRRLLLDRPAPGIVVRHRFQVARRCRRARRRHRADLYTLPVVRREARFFFN